MVPPYEIAGQGCEVGWANGEQNGEQMAFGETTPFPVG
jgi:hypothetical protein